MPTGSGPTSPTPQNNTNGADRKHSLDCGGSKSSTMSYDPTPYIQRARVTRPAPPKPSCNPMQFVQIKPCNLYQSAQEQLKRAEEVKKVKEIKKEEPEDWQSNLDNWKSSRRKRVEHIIDRVVEVKKLELEEHDRTRRKSKTFSEMLEERGSRKKLSTLPVYTEDESNDFSDLGIGTSSASGKSSLSEDYDNQSVMSDNVDTEKQPFDLDTNSNHDENCGINRDYISSPGYDTSSTAPASSPDPYEYTYEGAIQDYKTRISRAQSINYNNGFRNSCTSGAYSKDSTPERCISTETTYLSRRMSGNKIEDRLMNFEVKSPSDQENNHPKKDLPKVDILKRRELFEKENGIQQDDSNGQKRYSGDFSNSKTIKERLTSLEKKPDDGMKKSNRLSGDISTIKNRLQHLEKLNSSIDKVPKIQVPIVSLKDRLTSLHSAVTKEETKKPVLLVDDHQLAMLKKEDMAMKQALKQDHHDDDNINSSQEILNIQDESNVDTDREDSGIHTTDVSCSVSQTDEQPDLVNEETHHHINVDGLYQSPQEREPEPEPEHGSQLHDDIEKTENIPKSSIPDVIPAEINCELNQLQQSNEMIMANIDDEPLSLTSSEPPTDLEASVNEALEMALQAIDNENDDKNVKSCTEMNSINSIKSESIQLNVSKNEIISSKISEPIYENVDEIILDDLLKNQPQLPSTPAPSLDSNIIKMAIEDPKNDNHDKNIEEPYYQVPKSSEPYYEVPKYPRPVPVYENIEIFYPGSLDNDVVNYPLGSMIMEPPKEKPPPPPVEEVTDDEGGNDELYDSMIRKSSSTKQKSQSGLIKNDQQKGNQSIKRMNSTKRIKKELRNKRSSFLGIEGNNDDESFLELTVAPPPDMAQLLQEERRLEKQLYMKAGLYDSSDTGDSRDSGVSENHSRQSSEPFTTSSEEHEDLLVKNEKEIIEVLEKEEEKRRNVENWSGHDETDAKMRCIEDQIREQEEVLRVERELLQLEQEELKRQRENLILRENLARRELEHGAKMLMSANHHSLQDINATTNHYANIPNQIYKIETDYRKSMSDLQDFSLKRVPPAPPAKPMRSYLSVDSRQTAILGVSGVGKSLGVGDGLVKIANQTRIQHSQSTDEFVPMRNYQPNSMANHGNMTRHTLHALSATPKPKFTDGWVQAKKTGDKSSDSWLSYQQKRKSVPEGFNYKHWLIQEAEQRRIDQQRGLRNNSGNIMNGWSSSSAIQRNGSADNKPLPDAVIQTITQRVQSKGIGERKRLETSSSESIISPITASPQPSSAIIKSSSSLSQLNNSTLPEGSQDKILSVSGKKKCSHCGDELGRGAAMIIESLRLFYHIDCFKCCVCHVQLGDGLNGTDVRVRNQKLHCQNCYSSDDGIKFSCV